MQGRFPIMKRRSISLTIAVAALISCALAQTSGAHSGAHSSSTKSGPDPIANATKPLTPKSAMPAAHKSGAAAPTASTSSGKTNAELNRLERQKPETTSSKSGTGPAKVAAAPKSADKSATSDSMNFKYQKPVGGPQAATPSAHTANSGTPRVKKN